MGQRYISQRPKIFFHRKFTHPLRKAKHWPEIAKTIAFMKETDLGSNQIGPIFPQNQCIKMMEKRH